ncbi:hypothetical protein E2C01_070327 [Portunus trituberculatus]|uniref:Uncharacterized protein n=1 Tax=Portunus trituberculatus TaxID=210409 RepID=A0A5B7I375_PORTR|nr:hypothetical protein [Portunus trituberculatus]
MKRKDTEGCEGNRCAKTEDENKEMKKNNKKRKCETMEENEYNKKRKVDGFAMVTEHREEMKQHAEDSQNKRKRQDPEDHGIQNKKRKTTEDLEKNKSGNCKEQKKRKMECCKRVVDCIKKWKRQLTQCCENNTKKRKRQGTEDQESLAKKRKKERKKRWRLKCCERIVHRLRKRVKKDGEDVLRLKLEAERVRKEKRSVSSYCCIHMKEGYMVEATVLGKPCLVLLDSGASISVMILSLGQKLGLVTGHEETVKQRLSTWLGSLELDVIKLEEVVLVLEGGVVVNTPVAVFPQAMENIFGSEFIVLSMSRLQEAEMHQEFYQNGSCRLYLRHPERLKQRCETGCRGNTFKFAAQTLGIEDPLMVLVDTGADMEFYITKTGLDKVRSRTNPWILPPKRVRLQFGNSIDTLQTIEFSNKSASFHFAMGRQLFHQWKAVIDYVDSSITFTINKKHFRLLLSSR